MGVPEKPIYRGELPKKEGWTVSRFKGGLVVFLRREGVIP